MMRIMGIGIAYGDSYIFIIVMMMGIKIVMMISKMMMMFLVICGLQEEAREKIVDHPTQLAFGFLFEEGVQCIIRATVNPNPNPNSNPSYTLRSNQFTFKYKPPPLKLWGQ